jgi:hypothetical protein
VQEAAVQVGREETPDSKEEMEWQLLMLVLGDRAEQQFV